MRAAMWTSRRTTSITRCGTEARVPRSTARLARVGALVLLSHPFSALAEEPKAQVAVAVIGSPASEPAFRRAIRAALAGQELLPLAEERRDLAGRAGGPPADGGPPTCGAVCRTGRGGPRSASGGRGPQRSRAVPPEPRIVARIRLKGPGTDRLASLRVGRTPGQRPRTTKRASERLQVYLDETTPGRHRVVVWAPGFLELDQSLNLNRSGPPCSLSPPTSVRGCGGSKTLRSSLRLS